MSARKIGFLILLLGFGAAVETAPQKFELPNCIMDGSGRCVKSTYDRHLGAN